MIVSVVGSRDFLDYELLCKTLDELEFEITKIVSGGAIGADSLAKQYAEERGIELEEFLPNWKTFGKAAGMIRNKDIVKAGEFLVAFWDGKSRGTKDSIDTAYRMSKKVKMVLYNMK